MGLRMRIFEISLRESNINGWYEPSGAERDQHEILGGSSQKTYNADVPRHRCDLVEVR